MLFYHRLSISNCFQVWKKLFPNKRKFYLITRWKLSILNMFCIDLSLNLCVNHFLKKLLLNNYWQDINISYLKSLTKFASQRVIYLHLFHIELIALFCLNYLFTWRFNVIISRLMYGQPLMLQCENIIASLEFIPLFVLWKLIWKHWIPFIIY